MNKIYHCVTSRAKGTTTEILSSILSKGLVINDNGESEAIWFSDEPFKHPMRTPLILSLDTTEENIKRFYIADADSSQARAHRNIPIQYLNVESIAIMRTPTGFTHNNNKILHNIYLQSNRRKFMDWINSYEFKGGLTIYKDIMERYDPQLYTLVDWDRITNPNVKVETLNINESISPIKSKRHNNNTIRLTEKEFKKMLVECIDTLLKNILMENNHRDNIPRQKRQKENTFHV